MSRAPLPALLAVAVLLAGCGGDENSAAGGESGEPALEQVGEFDEPVFMTQPPDGGSLYVVERAGTIREVPDGGEAWVADDPALLARVEDAVAAEAGVAPGELLIDFPARESMLSVDIPLRTRAGVIERLTDEGRNVTLAVSLPPPSWRPGLDVSHTEHGAGWVWGSGRGLVTVRFEGPLTPPGPVRTFAADERSVAKAREFAREMLETWDAGDLADSVVLLVSELVTNAVVHAGTTARLELRLDPQSVRVEVEDLHPRRVLPMVVAEPTEDAEEGRGLLITFSLEPAVHTPGASRSEEISLSTGSGRCGFHWSSHSPSRITRMTRHHPGDNQGAPCDSAALFKGAWNACSLRIWVSVRSWVSVQEKWPVLHRRQSTWPVQ